MKTINYLDKLIFGWMALAVLSISSVFALDAYVTFGRSTLAFMLMFMLATGVQGMILGSIYGIIDAIDMLWSKHKAKTEPVKSMVKSASNEDMNSMDEPQTEELIPKDTAVFDKEASCTISMTQYATLNQHHAERQCEERQQLTDNILRYTERTFAPFMEYDELQSMLHEVEQWCHDSRYTPQSVRLRNITDYSRRLKVLDIKHYVWNIGTRLGTANGYKGEVRARFIKSLFPMLLSDNTISSLCNQTHDPDKGFITIDMPKPESNDFCATAETA